MALKWSIGPKKNHGDFFLVLSLYKIGQHILGHKLHPNTQKDPSLDYISMCF